jgi:hypothetical protein
MNAPALLLLFAAGVQPLADEIFQVPAGEWRYVSLALKQVPVTVECDAGVISGGGAVRVALLNQQGLDDLKQGDRSPLASGAILRQGTFQRVVSVADEYALVLENMGRDAATVRLQVSLDFSERGRPQARYLSHERRLGVILISTTVFLAIVAYSARKLLGVMRS